MEKKIKNLMLGMMLVLVVVVLVVPVDAYKLMCLGYGESVPSVDNPKYTCKHNFCQICVSDNLNPGVNPSHCSAMTCESVGGGGSIDSEPPVLIVNSPNEGDIFNSRRVLFDLNVNEESGIYYIDNINGRGRWSRIVSSIDAGDYSRSVSFRDGLNDVTIRAKDRKGNTVDVVRSFYVDSRKPRISKTYPKKGKFASGLFEIQFKEDNPVELKLFYGSQSVLLDVDNDCELIKGRYYCSVDVDLRGYSGEDVVYWFELKDIAGNVVDSKKVVVKVDVDEPVILNSNGFWSQGEGRYAKYVYFNIEIDEENFDEASYFYEDSRGRMREKRLCSRLKEGRCVAKKSFRWREVVEYSGG